MMKMAPNFQGVAKDYMETVDIRDIISKARQSVRRRLELPLSPMEYVFGNS